MEKCRRTYLFFNCVYLYNRVSINWVSQVVLSIPIFCNGLTQSLCIFQEAPSIILKRVGLLVCCKQCHQLTTLLFQHFALNSKRKFAQSHQKFTKLSTKFCQLLNRPLIIAKVFQIFCQSVEILPKCQSFAKSFHTGCKHNT